MWTVSVLLAVSLVGQGLIGNPAPVAASSGQVASLPAIESYAGFSNTAPLSSLSMPSIPLSGAKPAIPLNPALVGHEEVLSPSPTNFDFSELPVDLGGEPANFDFALAPFVSPVEPNHDFETGDLSGWEVVGSPTTVGDPNGGTAGLLLNSSDRLISSELAIVGSGARLSLDVGYVNTASYSYLRIYVRSGPTFSTVTQLGTAYCYRCGTWQNKTFSLSGYADQTIKLEFRAHNGLDVAIDNIGTLGDIPNWTSSGNVSYSTMGAGSLQVDGSSASAVSETITVLPGAEQITFDAMKNGSSGQLVVNVLHGPGFTNSTNVFYENFSNTSFESRAFDVTNWIGQDIQIEIKGAYKKVLVDNVGVQQDLVPSWTADRDPQYVDNGSGGTALSTNGSLLSDPYTIPNDVQQLLVRMRGTHTYDLIVHSGPQFDTETDTSITQLVPTTDWRDVPVPMSEFAGETVKLELRRNIGGSGTSFTDFDFVGVPHAALPGWTVSYGGALVGEDAIGGSFVSSDQTKTILTSDEITVHPSEIYRFTYSSEASDSLDVRVNWIDDTGQSFSIMSEADTAATPLTSRLFHLAGKAGTTGRLKIELFDNTKLYGVGGNVGAMLAAEPFALDVGIGIDTVSGAVRLSETDIRIEGANPFAFTRYYNSTSIIPGELGFGWTHNFDTKVVDLNNSSDRIVAFGAGTAEAFDYRLVSGAYGFIPFDRRVTSTLVKNPDDSYSYETKQGERYEFDADGLLESIVQRNGRTISLAYIGSGLDTISDDAGRSITINRDAAGKITSLTAPDGHDTTFSYTSNDLTSVTLPDGTSRSYNYDPQHLLTSTTDAEGTIGFTHTYDSFGRLTEQADATGAAITLSHDTPGFGATEVTDPEGGVGTFYFDTEFRTTDTVNPAGMHRRYLFDSEGNLDTIIDPAGESWSITYDPEYNVTGVDDPLGNPTNIQYDPEHLPTLITDALGNSTSFAYDANGNLTQTIDALGGVSVNTYDALGNLTSTTDPLGNASTFTHDAAGNVLTQTDPLGRTTSFTYDSLGRRRKTFTPSGAETFLSRDINGRLIGIVDPDGLATVYTYYGTGRLFRVADRAFDETTWTYDARGLPSTRTNADGTVESYAHDGDRNLTSVTDTLGRITSYNYDSAGRVTNRTDPLGAVTSYTYDTAGELASITDPLGRVQSRGYDARGNLMSITNADGTVVTLSYDELDRPTSVTDELGNTSTTTYDALGRIIENVDSLGGTTTHTYDAIGNVLSVEGPDGAIASMTYNAASEAVTSTDPTGAVTTQTYNVDGQPASVTSPSGATTSYGYNLLGWNTTTTDPLNRIWQKSFDDIGRLIGTTDPAGNGWTRAFNDMGEQTEWTDGLGNTAAATYDPAGQLTSAIDKAGRQTTYAYDSAGRMTSETDPLGGTVNYAYDLAGQLTSLTDANGATRSFEYDLRGRRTRSTDPLGRTTEIGYDAAGRPTSQVDDRGVVVTGTFDAAGQLTSRSFGGNTTTFAYDDAGRRTQIEDPRGTTAYNYDAAGRILNRATPEGAVSYTYDPDGRRQTMTSPSSTANYTYDLAGQLASISDGNGQTSNFTYDTRGLLQNIARPNGIDTTYTADANGQITQIVHEYSGVSLAQNSYTYDVAGNPASATDSGGTTAYTVDDLDRITTVSHPDGSQTGYSYDPAGNRLTETTAAGTVNYTYDNAGQLTDVDGQPYTYDEAGNLLDDGTNTYNWDTLNRLTSLTTGTDVTNYTYDPFGILVSVEDNGTSTSLLWDAASTLPTLVESGATVFQHGPSGVLTETTTAGTNYLLSDALGSVTHVTDQTGAVIGTADYSTFGERTTTGIQSSFGFTGELQSVDGIYLRSRHYNPGTGRFLSTDTVQPNAAGSQGYNLYAYAANNPTRWTDPTGHTVKERAALTILGSLLSSLLSLTAAEAFLFLVLAIAIVFLFIQILCAINGWDYSVCLFNIDTSPNPSNGGPSPDPDRPPPPGTCTDIETCPPEDPTPDPPAPEYLDWYEYLAQLSGGNYTADQIRHCHENWKVDPHACDGLTDDLLPVELQKRRSRHQPRAGSIDPMAVRFSQDSISQYWSDRPGTIDDLVRDLRSGALNPNDIQPIRIFVHDEKFFTLDNRRLWAFQQAGVNIPYRFATPAELDREFEDKFSTENDGASIQIRGR